jgi:hypothetical protein
MTLAACIRAYITDPNVKTWARRAAWLGNDFPLYVDGSIAMSEISNYMWGQRYAG